MLLTVGGFGVCATGATAQSAPETAVPAAGPSRATLYSDAPPEPIAPEVVTRDPDGRATVRAVRISEPLRIDGASNFLFLLGIVAVIFCSGAGIGNGGQPWPFGIQEGAMLLLAVAAWFTTRPENRARNRFSWTPVVEVAVLFAGIFVTMTPALLILNAWGQGERLVLGMGFELRAPAAFFWSTGLLSSFLDNAPTYLTFASTACGLEGVPLEGRYLAELLRAPNGPGLLEAISCGAVFMGANTYIGNGPNFMVKAIAEENGVRMPSFFGYMAWSLAILIPTFVVVTFVFFR